jgi:hypothetical protein
VGDLVTNAHAISRVNMGLPEELLSQLPKALQSVKALKTARGTFLQGLMTGSPEALDFAKSQLVSPEAEVGLIQAYRLWLEQQAVQLKQRLDLLSNLPTVELPAFLQRLPEAQQRQLEAVIENILTLPPVEQLKQLKAVMADIPQDMRGAFERFITSEHQRFAEMRVLEAKVQQQLAGQVNQAVTGVTEAFNPNNIKQQLSTALEEGKQAVQMQVEETTTSIQQAVNTYFVEPIQTKVAEVIATQTAGVGGGSPSLPVKAGLLSPPSSDGITFAPPLKVVEAQGEKLGWFPALMEQNKEWLPWAIGGTVGLGLLATIGVWVSKKRKSSSEVGASNNR